MSWTNLLFKEKEPVQDATAPAAAVSPLAERLRALNSTMTTSPVTRAPAAADPQFTQELIAEFAKGTAPGYQQFVEQCDLLKGVVPDETIRFKTALASTAKFLGLQPEQVIASIQERADLLVRAKDTFHADLKAEVDGRTTTYQRHLADVEKRLAENQLERERLSADKRDTERQLTEIRAETEAVQARFVGAYQPLYDNILSILNRVR